MSFCYHSINTSGLWNVISINVSPPPFQFFFRKTFLRLKKSSFPILTKAQNFSTKEYQWISTSVVVFMNLINKISPLFRPTFLQPKTFLSLASIRSLTNLISIVNQITLESSMLLFVLTVPLAIVMILSHVLSTNGFDNFVNPITLTIFAFTQLLLPSHFLEKRFLFDVGFNCKILITMQLVLMISFLVNPL